MPSSQTAAIIAAHVVLRTLVCRLFPLVAAPLCAHGLALCSGRWWTAVGRHCANGRGHCNRSEAGVCEQLAVGFDRSLVCGPAYCASWGVWVHLGTIASVGSPRMHGFQQQCL